MMDIPTYCCICLGTLATEEEKERFKDSKYGFLGHNANPLMNGRCCSKCDENLVIPTRIRRLQAYRMSAKSIA
jgi:hypothetical protein